AIEGLALGHNLNEGGGQLNFQCYPLPAPNGLDIWLAPPDSIQSKPGRFGTGLGEAGVGFQARDDQGLVVPVRNALLGVGVFQGVDCVVVQTLETSAFFAAIAVFQVKPIFTLLPSCHRSQNHGAVAPLADIADVAFDQVMFEVQAPLYDQVAIVAFPDELLQGQVLA